MSLELESGMAVSHDARIEIAGATGSEVNQSIRKMASKIDRDEVHDATFVSSRTIDAVYGDAFSLYFPPEILR